MPEIEKFFNFWCSIWEKKERKPKMHWMTEVKRLFGKKVTVINEFDIDTEKQRKKSTKERAGRSQVSMEYKTFDGKS